MRSKLLLHLTPITHIRTAIGMIINYITHYFNDIEIPIIKPYYIILF